MQLIEFTEKGLFCRAGNFYIDPWQPVDHAIITHAHSDHAKWGSKNYLSHVLCKPLLQARLGNNNYETLEWNETRTINGVKVSLHPAGHIIGSSQVRVEYNNEVWVASGAYKVADDGLSGAFEPVKCHAFITESTFGYLFIAGKTRRLFLRIYATGYSLTKRSTSKHYYRLQFG
jgi:putative mRNA 3-end processing factor